MPAESYPHPQTPIILGAFVKSMRKTRRIKHCYVRPNLPTPANSHEFSYSVFLRLVDTFRFWWKRTVTRHFTRKLPYARIYDISPLLVVVIGADFALRGTRWTEETINNLNISNFIDFKFPCLPY